MPLRAYRRPRVPLARVTDLTERFGIRSLAQLERDLAFLWSEWSARRGFQLGLSTLGFARPDLALPALAGLVPADGLAPILHLYDRTTGGRRYSQRVTRKSARDFRGGRLSYDDHDGIDFVCPVGSLVVAPAAGVVVAIRDRWLRGGLTVCVDHGHGVVTQVTHCSASLRQPGERVARGAPIARSGLSGIDMALSFPWVPPHVHFSVWVSGAVVDPFRASGERPRAGCWALDNRPVPAPAAPTPHLADARESPIDEAALDRACRACRDAELRAELERAAPYRPGVAAIIEDALHHERYAFDAEQLGSSVRPAGTGQQGAARAIGLTLPLSSADYVGSRFADAPWTRPR